jgi:kynurenine 3-monooxygenase
MVPFYGQGMNCAFEDVRVLAGLVDKQLFTAETQGRGDQTVDWKAVFENYCSLRKPNTDAIQDMAEENFYEMRDATADPVFQRKRALETRLEQTYPDYFSKYSMVTFREDLPYSIAKDRGNAQDRLLMEICTKTDKIDDLDLDEVMREVNEL